MKFFSSKIVTKQVSLESVKNLKPAKVRSLDEIIADARQVKTAAAQAEVKTAAAEAPKSEVTQTETKAEAPKVEIKTAAEFVRGPNGQIQMDPAAAIEPEVISLNPAEDKAEIGHGFDKVKWDGTAPKDMVGGTGQPLTPQEGGAYFGKKKWETGAYPVKPQDAADALHQKTPMTGLNRPQPQVGVQPAPKAPKAPAAMPLASSKKTLKIASKINFTKWEDAQQVVDAWKQHGTQEACCSNVAGQTSDPQTYCKLLSVAANVASEQIKTAASKKQSKVASAKGEKTAAPLYKKIAKLKKEDLSDLREYWTKIYGNEYVEAMLGDF